MIVKMKKATILCLGSDKEKVLEQLRELGVLHVEIVEKPESKDIDSASKEFDATDAALQAIVNAKGKGTLPEGSALSGKEVCEKALALQARIASTSKILDALNRDREKLLPWGSFRYETIEELKSKGIHVYLCSGSQSDIDVLPEGAAASIVSKNGPTLFYAVCSAKELDPLALHALSLPKASLQELSAEIEKLERETISDSNELASLRACFKALDEYHSELESKLEFFTNRDAMASAGAIAYMQGYVPVTDEEMLRKSAQEQGWGLVLEDPTLDDNPPTLIRKPAWMNIIDPVFKLVGVMPGYREFDVNIFFLIFFTIFFGMIMADSGYAMGFLAISFLAKFLVKDKKMQVPINLFILLSSWTLVWGLVTGCFFGISPEALRARGFGFLAGLPMLTDPEHSHLAEWLHHKYGVSHEEVLDKCIQWFCFLLAALHLGAARVYRGFAEIKHSWHGFGDFGWALLIVCNFLMAVNLIVFNGSFPSFGIWLYVASVVMIVASLDWKNTAHLLHLPFALIGSFTDVLSYIRLFAVGMSGLFIAKCFNQMGGMAYDSLPQSLSIVAVIFAMIVILFGHGLNIALASLGVLVHAIRLNSLEFSNQMELQWTGTPYKPFSKNDKNSQP